MRGDCANKRDMKELVEGAKEFVAWAGRNSVRATLLLGPHTGHHVTDTKIDEQLVIALGKFIFEP